MAKGNQSKGERRGSVAAGDRRSQARTEMFSGGLHAGNPGLEGRFGEGRGVSGFSESVRSETVPVLCREIMTTNPVACTLSDTVRSVARIMRGKDGNLIREKQRMIRMRGGEALRGPALSVFGR